MKNLMKAGILLCGLALMGGCASTSRPMVPFTGPKGGQYTAWEERYLWNLEQYRVEFRQHYAETTPGLSDAQRKNIAEGKITVGMTTEMVRASWGLYGTREPEITRSIDTRGTAEFWRQRNAVGLGDWTLYFRNDRLADITQRR
jgi:hypothetical protein